MRWNLCRICLSGNANTNLTNTQLLDIYKRITSNQWDRNQRPDTICHICHSMLKKCLKLRKMSKQSELIFTQFFAGGFEFTEETAPILTTRKLHQLLVSPVLNFTLGNRSDDVEEITLEGKGPFEIIEIIPENTEEESSLKQKAQKQSPTKKHMAKDTHQEKNENFSSNENVQLSCKLGKRRTRRAEPLVYNAKVTEEMIGKGTRHTADKNVLNDSKISENSGKKIFFTLRFNLSQTYNNDTMVKKKSKFDSFNKSIKPAKTLSTCDYCGQTFTEAYSLENHIKTHIKTFLCEVCQKTFFTKSNLQKHKKIHERPHACERCPKKFDSKRQLGIHLRSHSNKTTYVCNICEKSFPQLSNLTQHERVHTGETPYTLVIYAGKSSSKKVTYCNTAGLIPKKSHTSAIRALRHLHNLAI